MSFSILLFDILYFQLSGIQFLPESPRWLLIQGNIIEAHRIMKMLGIVEMEFMGDTNLSISPDFQSITGESSINREDSSLSENLIKPTKENANANYRLSRTTIGMSPKAMNQTKGRFRSAKRTSILKRVSSCKLLLIACGIGIAQNVLCTNAALYFSMDLMWLARICKPYEWGIGLSIIKVSISSLSLKRVKDLLRSELLVINIEICVSSLLGQ